MDVVNVKWHVLRTIFSAAIVTLVFAANGFAAALVQDVKGDVRTEAAAVAKGQRILTGATLTTGPNSQAILVFDDGQQVVLNENTQFAITDYQFQQQSPQSDRSFFSLLRGAARVVTGALAQRNRTAFEFRTATATIGVRGTDFMVAIVNQPSYTSVLQGEIAATNAAGTVTFGAGTFGAIAAPTVLAVAIPAAALPAAAASAFSSLGAVSLGVGASAAVSGAAGGVGAGVGALAVVGGVAVAAAAAGGGGGGGGGGTAGTSAPSASPSAGASAFAGPAHGSFQITVSVTGTTPASGTCSGTWTGTTDSSGLFTGTETLTSCAGAATSYVNLSTGAPTPISFQLDASGNIAPQTFSTPSGAVTISCTYFGGGSAFGATSVSLSGSCSVTGTSSGSVSWSYTGTRP